ncbi:hypothetical protein EGW08_004010 [Elysia chlorotica]|uniref:Uncharacterized protein n=1 Tax=Elysia chlorotica TaxID=188477 RepID=A0A3S1BP99_ELYCH|nr:hypothetical protein EGW08_004010 [Elysia chlorotica]
MLRVGFTSWGRPDHFAFAQHRGSDVLHTGSALVCDIVERSGACCCSDCARCPTQARHQAWFEIHLETALHVIYDTEEARATRVDFFYDDDQAIAAGRRKTVWASEVKHIHSEADFCSFVCATHDTSLVRQLQQHLAQSTKTKFYGLSGCWMSAGWDHVCVIASHPHGQPKKITVGRLTNERELSPLHRYFIYSVDTCPGSSGARGAVIELSKGKRSSRFSMRLLPPHSSRLGSREINVSSASVAGYAQPEIAGLLENIRFNPMWLNSAIW